MWTFRHSAPWVVVQYLTFFLKFSQTPLRMSKALKAWQDISDSAALKSPYYLADFNLMNVAQNSSFGQSRIS